jgi:hypothetical protein
VFRLAVLRKQSKGDAYQNITLWVLAHGPQPYSFSLECINSYIASELSGHVKEVLLGLPGAEWLILRGWFYATCNSYK